MIASVGGAVHGRLGRVSPESWLGRKVPTQRRWSLQEPVDNACEIVEIGELVRWNWACSQTR